jgi:hypothetical protein
MAAFVFATIVMSGAMDVVTVAVMRVHHQVGSHLSAICGIVPSSSCRRK